VSFKNALNLIFNCIKRFKNKFLNRHLNYQSGNQKPQIEESQKIQWPKEKGQKHRHQDYIQPEAFVALLIFWLPIVYQD
jgi:hypothetical protein